MLLDRRFALRSAMEFARKERQKKIDFMVNMPDATAAGKVGLTSFISGFIFFSPTIAPHVYG
jgi:hypothetical protein